MEYLGIWKAIFESQSFIIVDPVVLEDLGSEDFVVKEGELVVSCLACKGLYEKGLRCIKEYRVNKVWSKDLEILLDLTVLINGELGMAWNVKHENIDKLDISQQIHVNMLSIKLHRKAAIAWEFRKRLIGFEFPENELETLDNLQVFHKQNYYLWEYRRWVFNEHLTGTVRESEYEKMLKYCSGHPSDSSAFHYLGFISEALGFNPRTYHWVSGLCDTYYGVFGLYNERSPVGLETLCLLRAKMREGPEQDMDFVDQQISLKRKTPYLHKPS